MTSFRSIENYSEILSEQKIRDHIFFILSRVLFIRYPNIKIAVIYLVLVNKKLHIA